MDPYLVAMQQRAARPPETAQKAPEIDHWLTIFGKQYEMVKKLGSGGEADTYLYLLRQAQSYGPQSKLAVKVSKPEVNQKPSRQEAYSWQITIHPQLKHPHVCRCLDYFPFGPFNVIVMEYCNQGSLKDLQTSRRVVDEITVRNLAFQTLEGLEYIHRSGFIHRDIKLDNIFLSGTEDSLVCKIGDFGLAIPAHLDQSAIRFAGTPQYIAPEIIAMHYSKAAESPDLKYLKSLITADIKKPITEKIDIWALGVTFFNLLTGFKPFQDTKNSNSHIKTYEVILKGRYCWEGRISRAGMHFIDLCLTADPELRPSCSDLLKHPWFSTRLAPVSPPQYPPTSHHGRAVLLPQSLPQSTINYYGPLVLNHEFSSYYGNFVLLSNALFFAKFNDDSCGVYDVLNNVARVYKNNHSSFYMDFTNLEAISKERGEDYFFVKRALLLYKYYCNCRISSHFTVRKAGAFSNNICVNNQIMIQGEGANCSLIRYDNMVILCLSGNRSMIYDAANGVVHYYISHQQSRTYRILEVLSNPEGFGNLYTYAKVLRETKI